MLEFDQSVAEVQDESIDVRVLSLNLTAIGGLALSGRPALVLGPSSSDIAMLGCGSAGGVTRRSLSGSMPCTDQPSRLQGLLPGAGQGDLG